MDNDQKVDSFCEKFVKYYSSLNIADFQLCVKKILDYIVFHNLNCKSYYNYALNGMRDFMYRIGRLYYGKCKKNDKYKEPLKIILNSYDKKWLKKVEKFYKKYVENKYSIYFRCKKHYETVVLFNEMENTFKGIPNENN
jgi:hypothetical protein